jgi:hypothetical protein
MNKVSEILGSIFFLIGVYLFLSNYHATVAIIQTMASNGTQGIKTLQGRG